MNNELIKKLNERLPDSEKMNLEELDKLKEENNLPLKPIKNHGLNEDQTTTLARILDWLYTYKGARNENNMFALRGSAGTGKTTLLGVLLKEIDKNKYWKHKICICAPTHKAKKVLQNKTKWAYAETLQSLLGLKLDTNIDDFDPNKPEFTQIGERKIKDYMLVIIDESSMANTNLFKLIEESAKGVMILFVGDTKQLNPVKETAISLALTKPIHSYDLTQIMRQGKDNPLVGLLDIVREDIETGRNTYLDVMRGMKTNLNDKGEGYVMSTEQDFMVEKMKEVFTSQDFQDDKNHVRYISWTNDSIMRTNRYLRKNILQHLNTIAEGEVLLSYKTIMDDNEVIITNSDDYMVKSVTETIVSNYTYPLQCYIVELEGIDTGKEATVTVLKREEENYKNYIAIYDQFLQTAKAKRGSEWKKFFNFKHDVLILENVPYKSNITYQDELITKDMDFGYGITIHKSQGSTYNTVFVNGKDILRNPNEIERKRLFYVALSRASKNAYIIM